MSNIKDSFKIKDELSINSGVIAMSHTPTKIIGEITIDEIDPLGNVIASNKEYNDITIGGATFILEQMFKERSLHDRFRLTGLNNEEYKWIDDKIYVNVNSNYIKDEKIFGFMVGIGGEEITSVKAPNYTNRQLDEFIQFRVTSENGIIDEPGNYKYMMPDSFTMNGTEYTGYYVKGFYDSRNEAGTKASGQTNGLDIIPEYTDGSGIVNEEDMNSTDSPIYTYARLIMEIDTRDIREYFRCRDQNIDNCYINQLGLVAGRPSESNDKFYDDCKLITICNFKKRDLSNDENTLRFTYKIYCM